MVGKWVWVFNYSYLVVDMCCVLLTLSAGVIIDIEIVICVNVLNLTFVVLQCVPETRHLQKFWLKGEFSLATEGTMTLHKQIML